MTRHSKCQFLGKSIQVFAFFIDFLDKSIYVFAFFIDFLDYWGKWESIGRKEIKFQYNRVKREKQDCFSFEKNRGTLYLKTILCIVLG